ncbi:uncharacterized protein K460DRAFT_69137 [Cucurbitaria berberidis CBS 394.84]|uniref:Uncharacterized protein n=1 Tax=Cucurbitaria berberidis CBS 394.84 TaxID=1168544 RepID=A0A9P4LBI0_9PLEO|nr:uncharacterized protein K460DRAFT_69137 [Cucurbitaria berberidis CBS 394.84]KAF1848209.1 hypothetical protein K460DRAFT_69137 [Cucurbitaria berberidis CBS 394.84]
MNMQDMGGNLHTTTCSGPIVYALVVFMCGCCLDWMFTVSLTLTPFSVLEGGTNGRLPRQRPRTAQLAQRVRLPVITIPFATSLLLRWMLVESRLAR